MAGEQEELVAKLPIWLKELRAPFFTAVLIPVFLGTVIAWYMTGAYNLAYFILNLLGVVCINAGTNLANDYFDYKSGCDSIDADFTSPFSGGSGLLPRGVLDPKQVHAASLIFFLLAGIVGILLTVAVGWTIVILGIVGVLSGYFYTTQLAPRGIGEFVVGLNCGPLVVIGSYYVQTQSFALEPIIASIPVGILILTVLWINEIPDFHVDAKAGKRTLVTRIGRKKAADVYSLLSLCTYATILLGVSLRLMPIISLLSFATVPLAIKAIRIARREYENPRSLVPANATTVLVHLFTGLLLCLAYVISGFYPF